MMQNIFKLITVFAAFLTLISCNTETKNQKEGDDPVKVVATTTMIADLLENIGGEKTEINGLMGPGVDPHLYKASENDVQHLFNAEIVFYNGLHLEGKLVDIFERMKQRGKHLYPITDTVNNNDLIPSGEFESNYDPHIWFDISIWKTATKYVTEKLADYDPENKEYYNKNKEKYLAKLDSLQEEITALISQVPEDKRILITAHDAFKYFGKAYDFKVMGIQGISTASEAGVKDIQNLSNIIVKNQIKAIFVETSVPERNIKALQKSVRSKGFKVNVGGQLYSDALGSKSEKTGTYTGMFRHNVETIAKGIK